MCNLTVGQKVTLTGRILCKSCGCVMQSGNKGAAFAGHDSGFDVFHLDTALICPWCDTENEAGEMPCSDPIVLVLEEQRDEIERE